MIQHPAKRATAGAIANARDTLETIEATLPVATPDQLEHLALDLRILAACLTGSATAQRQTDPKPATTLAWWM